MNIKKIMLRYYVPFSFKCYTANHYRVTCDECKQSFGAQSTPVKPDNDFYDNINRLYMPDNNSAIGAYFDSSAIDLPHLISDDKKYSVKITKAGLFINKNGVGILWYEIDPCKELLHDEKLLIAFQNDFKELSRPKPKFNWLQHTTKKVELDYVHQGKTEVLFNRSKISDFIKQNNLSFDPENVNKIVLNPQQKAMLFYSEYTEFQMGTWIYDILHFIDRIHFMPERIKKKNRINTPDKAIICNCVAYESDNREEALDFIFLMTRGYTTNYQRKDDFENDLYVPFKNIDWYAAQEGMGQYIHLTDPAKDAFFYDLAFYRMTNYCYLLAIVLQQYYSLLNYSKKIADLADDKEYISKEAYEQMLFVTDNMNEFFLRNTFPQISHISHQNGVYQYLREMYRIGDFFDQVSNGLNSVMERTEMYRNKQHDDYIKLFAILGAVIGLSDVVCSSSDVVGMMFGASAKAINPWLAIAGLLLFYIGIGLLIWAIWYKFKHRPVKYEKLKLKKSKHKKLKFKKKK